MNFPAETWVQRPKQARSQRTLDALLDAAEALLATRAFHELRVDEIVARAGSSSGSFYARFADKSALLHALHERLLVRVRDEIEKLLPEGAGRSLERGALERLLVAAAIETHRRHRGTLRAALVEAMHDRRFAARALALGDETAAVLAARLSECKHSGPVDDRAVVRALRLVMAVLDQQLFIDPDANFGDLDDEALVEWLTRIFACALRDAGGAAHGTH